MTEKKTFKELASLYCESQEQTPKGLRQLLPAQCKKFDSQGFMLLRCTDMWASQQGHRTILGFGGTHTFQKVPDHPISPRGLASDMSVVECWCDADDLWRRWP